MKHLSHSHVSALFVLSLLLCSSIDAQDSSKWENVRLAKTIHLQDLKAGPIDLEVNLKDTVVYIVSTEDNLIRAVNFLTGKSLGLISNISQPRKVCYLPDKDELFITTGTTKCFLYDSKNFQRLWKINIMSATTDAVYDEGRHSIYFGYEEGIKRMDVNSHKITGFMPFYSEPNLLGLDKSKSRGYVMLPDRNQIFIIDLSLFKKAGEWESDFGFGNSIAIDTLEQKVFVATKNPSQVMVINSLTGRKNYLALNQSEIRNISLDKERNRVYISSKNEIRMLEKTVAGYQMRSFIATKGNLIQACFIEQYHVLLSVDGNELMIYNTN